MKNDRIFYSFINYDSHGFRRITVFKEGVRDRQFHWLNEKHKSLSWRVVIFFLRNSEYLHPQIPGLLCGPAPDIIYLYLDYDIVLFHIKGKNYQNANFRGNTNSGRGCIYLIIKDKNTGYENSNIFISCISIL